MNRDKRIALLRSVEHLVQICIGEDEDYNMRALMAAGDI